MQKLITLSDAQYAYIQSLMQETHHESFSEFVRYLALFYEQNKKRAQGRPRTASSEDDAEDEVLKYKSPEYDMAGPMADKNVYSYKDLVTKYALNPQWGPMPERDALPLHPNPEMYS